MTPGQLKVFMASWTVFCFFGGAAVGIWAVRHVFGACL